MEIQLLLLNIQVKNRVGILYTSVAVSACETVIHSNYLTNKEKNRRFYRTLDLFISCSLSQEDRIKFPCL